MTGRESGTFASDAGGRAVTVAFLQELVDLLLERLGPTARFQALRRGLVADCAVVGDGDGGELCLLGPVAAGIVNRLADDLCREADSLGDRLDVAFGSALAAARGDRDAPPAACFGVYEGFLSGGAVPAPPAFLDGAGAVYVRLLSEDGVRLLGCRTPAQHAVRIAGALRAGDGPAGSAPDDDAPADGGKADGARFEVPCWQRVPVDAGGIRLGADLAGRTGFREGDELAVVGCGDCFEIWRAADWRACVDGSPDVLEGELFGDGAFDAGPAGR